MHQGGFSLIEVLIAGAVLAVAMTSYVTGIISHRVLASEDVVRSRRLLLADQFLERLRTDDDFAGLWARCRVNLALSAARTGTTTDLDDGRGAFPATTYYPDFAGAEALAVLVDVPSGPDVVTKDAVLREDLSAPDFGLPADLDGDGAIGSVALDTTYQALPVLVHFVWSGASDDTRSFRVFTWLRGDR